MKLAACVSSLLLAATAYSDGLLENMDREVSALCAKSKDAVVKVHAHRPLSAAGAIFGPGHRVGTGFFVDAQGRLLTSASVVTDATNCWVEWRGEKVAARVLGRDPLTNLALVQVDRETPFLNAGTGELQVGSMVVVLGFPYEQPCEPAVGFVAGFDIKCGGHSFLTPHFRTGSKLRPGQGGAPVLNTRGEVVGVAVAATPQQDQTYVLPIHAAQKVARDIQQTGNAQHGWIGLSVSELATNNNAWAVTVQQIYSNTPAADAGFLPGDVLLAIHTNEVHSAADLLTHSFQHRQGDKLEFTVLRNGQPQQLRLTVGERPVEETPPARLPAHTPPRIVVVPANATR